MMVGSGIAWRRWLLVGLWVVGWGGCGGDLPPLPYPKGSIVAIEVNNKPDPEANRPIELPRVTDPETIERFIQAVNRHATRVEQPLQAVYTATLHLIRDGRPAIDLGIAAPAGSETIGIYVERKFYAAERTRLADALRSVGVQLADE
ncbi:MAG: hypothetical protein KatS3mg108_1527 [Isosphaeraceae bacterium]|jgi:hypothetical protein|nr:MAG: hypothetical protein KatS3mg108_1527 [Isosphaeraceae bacterium]